jgi:DnaK suppressor protein
LKAQPKVAAKTKKPAAKAKPAAKVTKPVAPVVKAVAKKAPVKPAAKSPARTTRPAAKAPAKPAAKAAGKTSARTAPKAVPAKTAAPPAAKAAKTAAGKALGAMAKAVVSGAKAVVAAARKLPAKPGPAPVAVAAKASPPSATPATPAAQTVPARKSSQHALRNSPPPPTSLSVPGAAKATYTPMATPQTVLPPPVAAVKKDPKLANNWKTKSIEELTDAEVLAMPDSEYMNEKQMAFFRFKLEQLKQEILNSAGETTEHLREDTVIVPDPADRATIEEEHALELRTRDRERKLLKKIEQSIARIDAGDYGYCDETGEPIGVGRLLARPTATLSLEAQQRRELKQKMFGD